MTAVPMVPEGRHYDVVDDAVTALGQRRGAWFGHDLAVLALVASLIDQAKHLLAQLVHDARANGHS